MKIQPAVKKETLHIALGVVVLSVVENLVFLLVGQWTLPVLWGTLLGGGWAVLSFFLMALTVQIATNATDNRQRNIVQLSYSLRMLVMLGVCVLGFTLPVFHWLPVMLAQIFPRITILLLRGTELVKDEPDPAAVQAAQERAAQQAEAPSDDAQPEPYNKDLARKGTQSILEEILEEGKEEDGK